MAVAPFVTSLIMNPATVVSFTTPYALGDRDTILLKALNAALEEEGLTAPELKTEIGSTEDLQKIVRGLGSLQVRNPNGYSTAVGKAKDLAKTKIRQLPPPVLTAPLTTLLHEIERVQGVPLEAEILRMQEILQAFLENRAHLSEQDWAELSASAQTPIEYLFVNFVRHSGSLSPAHWMLHRTDTPDRPPNPTVTISVGSFKIAGVGNWVIPEPGIFMILGGIWVNFSGPEISIIPMSEGRIAVNGRLLQERECCPVRAEDKIYVDGREANLQVRPFVCEVPLTGWPKYQQTAEDAHPHAFKNYLPRQKWKGQKYVIIRRADGQYIARVGTEHHYQMIDSGDILVAGGRIFMNAEGDIVLNGGTTRFGHIMKDDFYSVRVGIAAQVIGSVMLSLGYRYKIFVTAG